MCGGSILSCCPRNLHGHERALKEEEDTLRQTAKSNTMVYCVQNKDNRYCVQVHHPRWER